MAENPLTSVLRTLLINGYTIGEVDRISARATVVIVGKRNKLGGIGRSVLLFADAPSGNLLALLQSKAKKSGAQPMVITNQVLKMPSMSSRRFFELLGGEIRSDQLLRNDLPSVLDAFGHNRGYNGFVGTPDDLLEEFINESLQYLLDSRGYRFGQERLFESLPDGLILGPKQFNVYFDGKAYKEGFHPSADDIKRFIAYVSDFNDRYESIVGRIHCLLLVSGSFPKGKEALEGKAAEFYAGCGSRLCFLRAKDLGEIVTTVRARCASRSSIKWKTIFSQLVIDPTLVNDEIERVLKDAIGED